MLSETIKQVCFIGIFLTPSVLLSRKYDIDAEAMRLFGESIGTVLRRFRRSPDYLKILQEKHAEMGTSFYEVNIQTTQYVENKLTQRVSEMTGYSKDHGSVSSANQTSFRAMKFGRKQRRGNAVDSREKVDPIKELDGYDHLHLALNVVDRNRFKDLGFEMAGLWVNLLIKGMGPDDTPSRATTKADETNTTPDNKREEHEVHSTLQEPEISTDKTFKFKHFRL